MMTLRRARSSQLARPLAIAKIIFQGTEAPMHRSRLSLLVIFAGAGACSTRDDSKGTKILSQDSTLAAQLNVGEKQPQAPLPDACSTSTVAARPAAAANKAEAEKLTKQAYNAEMLGNLKEATSLLRRASELDGTDKSAAYHLARSSEAIGDRAGAVTAYCRYLALAPTTAESAESVEARERVAELSQNSKTHSAAGSVSDTTPARRRAAPPTARRLARKQPAVDRRVVTRASAEQPVRATSPERGTRTDSASAVAVGPTEVPRSNPVTSSPDVDGKADRGAVVDDAVATPRPVPVDRSSAARSGPSRAQGAGIGAVTGVIIGAATGRTVKSAVIGGAAGGILGAVVIGRGTRPVIRGIRQ